MFFFCFKEITLQTKISFDKANRNRLLMGIDIEQYKQGSCGILYAYAIRKRKQDVAVMLSV